MKKKIHLQVKEGKKVIVDKEVGLKDLTIDEIVEYEDLMTEHTMQVSSDKPLLGVYSRVLKFIRLSTDLTDDEIKDIGREGRMQLFVILIKEAEKKS